MSLINQVLRDLERREPGFQGEHLQPTFALPPSPHHINPAQALDWSIPADEASSMRKMWMIGLGLTLLLSAGGSLWWLNSKDSTPTDTIRAASVPPDAAAQIALAAVKFEPDQKAEVPPLPAAEPEPAASPPVALVSPERSAVAKPVIKAVALAQTVKPAAGSVQAPKTATVSSPQAIAEASPAARAEQLFQQAQAELKQGQAAASLNSLRAALEAEPRHVQARISLARLLAESKQLTAASDLLADGVMLLPQQNAFVLALAPLWFQAGQQDDAMALLANSVRQPSATPQLTSYYASQLLRLKRYTEAATQFRSALRSDPAQADWLIGLGLSLQGSGQNREAVDALRSAYETGKLNAERKDLVEQMIAGLKARL